MPHDPASPDRETPIVLLIDDDPLIAVVVRRALQGISGECVVAEDGASGVAAAKDRRPDLIVLDNVLPDAVGVDVLNELQSVAPDVPVLFITAMGSGGTAIEAMKRGAFDYLPKPLDPTRLRAQFERAFLLRRQLKGSATAPLASASPTATNAVAGQAMTDPADVLIGQCPPMQQVFKTIGRVAAQDVAVLIRGEHGVGKEAVAREIHRHGRSPDGPFTKLNCRGLDDARLEADLFGVATEGASAPGKISEADGGTLVLQEVGELSLPLQSRLLRAVRDRVYEPVDGEEQLVNCRIVAITSEDLEAKARASNFRSDLYYALSSFIIPIPPLRQRHGDLPLLIERLLSRLVPIAREFHVDMPTVSPEAMQTLCAHLWPGNIDELESVLRRALVEQKGNILLTADLGQALGGESAVAAAAPGASARHSVDWAAFSAVRIEAGSDTLHADAVAETERRIFEYVLNHTSGNQAQASRILGITRASLRKKLRMYGMAPRPLDD